MKGYGALFLIAHVVTVVTVVAMCFVPVWILLEATAPTPVHQQTFNPAAMLDTSRVVHLEGN